MRWLIFVIGTLLWIGCTPVNPLAEDMDGDGFSTFQGDCDDNNALVYPGAATEASADQCMQDNDHDGFGNSTPPDGFDIGTDCDDNDGSTYPGAAEHESSTACMTDQDGDGYGAMQWVGVGDQAMDFVVGIDCDDGDKISTIVPEDNDCDSTTASDDCDDTDPLSTIVAEDGDCDGTLTADDCDDTNASSTIIAQDNDCDGVMVGDDCNDNDETQPALDNDCDGVLTTADCDDSNPSTVNDMDCDGLTASEDCNDSNAALPMSGCEGCTSGWDCQYTTSSTGSYVSDISTGLDWEIGGTGASTVMYLSTAESYCDNLGSDWRLPTQNELISLCGSQLSHPNGGWGTTLDLVTFPDWVFGLSYPYWTSDPNYPCCHWAFSPVGCDTYSHTCCSNPSNDPPEEGYARCVRDTP
jgi:hypothetical protein